MIVDQNTSSTPGSNQHPAVTSCQTLLKQSPTTSTGVYWIHTDGGSQANAFKAYCNMDFFFETFAFIIKHNSIKHFLQCKAHYATLLIIQVFTESKQ